MFKKKENRPEASGKKGSTVMKFLGSFVLAAVLFGVLISVERNLLSDYAKELVVLCKAEVQKGTKITRENVGQYFYTHEVDVALTDENCVKDKNELIGTVVARTLSAQEIVRKDMFTKESDIYAKYQDPVEGSITADNPGDVVSGTIRRGDYVDIAVVNKDTLQYDLMLKNVYVLDAFTNTGEKLGEDVQGAATMLTIVEEKDNLAKYYSAVETGNVIVTKMEYGN